MKKKFLAVLLANLCDKKYHIQRGHMEKATLL